MNDPKLDELDRRLTKVERKIERLITAAKELPASEARDNLYRALREIDEGN